MNETFMSAIINLLAVDSIGSIIARALLWLAIMTIIAWGTAKGKSHSSIKAEVGFFMMFIILSGVMIYLMFGVIPTISTKPTSLELGTLFIALSYELSKLRNVTTQAVA